MVNKTELLAVGWLKRKGYKENEIIKNSNSSPDFICQDGKRYEVKFLYRNKIIFYTTQIKNLKDDDIILVFDRTNFITQFLWKDRKNISIDIKIVETSNQTSIQLRNDTLEKLKFFKDYKRETYDDLLNKLMKIVEFISKIEPELREAVLKEILEARKEIEEGKGRSTEKIAKELGIKL